MHPQESLVIFHLCAIPQTKQVQHIVKLAHPRPVCPRSEGLSRLKDRHSTDTSNHCTRFQWYYCFLLHQQLGVQEVTPSNLTEFMIRLHNG
ncbi:hypothetical protein [Ktedonobacter sp. SOSP1-85]|uniref:hypothetical protein n=1 Tax=Ktedonobacter sp. SOSP1-85 TaxID=2778367 RepID=UPI0019168818|nr:hypothetical protein [Ktedonobacter sp. SOSP1-85]